MAIKTRVESIARDIDLIVSDTLSPAAQSKEIADYARGEIHASDEINRQILGRVPPRVTTVNGSVGADLDSVTVGGSIIVEWEIVTDVMLWIGQTLRDRSPFVSGDYQRAHTLFADGVEVPLGSQIPHADEYIFTNPLPYARKIEIGKTKAGRDFVIQVPNKIYERTAADAKARFGNIVSIKFVYQAVHAGATLDYVPISRRRREVSTERRAAATFERHRRVPAIILHLKAA